MDSAARKGLKSIGRRDWASWPRYEAAVLGFREYWYPVTWSRHVTRRPYPVTLLGESLALVRDEANGVRCVRVGVPAIPDEGSQGSSAELEYRGYPAAERLGLVWVYIGDRDAPPVETDIPSEMLDADSLVVGRITTRPGNWRFGAENGFDDGHAKYLHRKSLWVARRQMPAWTRMHVEESGEGWLTRKMDEVHYDDVYPGLGSWPPKPRPWKRRGKGGARTSIRLPAMLRVEYANWSHFEWWVGTGPDEHIYVQLAATHATGLKAIRFRAYYRLLVRWVFHGMFNDEDRLMVDVMDAPPERLYRPDVSLTEWRKLCERTARGEAVGATEQPAA